MVSLRESQSTAPVPSVSSVRLLESSSETEAALSIPGYNGRHLRLLFTGEQLGLVDEVRLGESRVAPTKVPLDSIALEVEIFFSWQAFGNFGGTWRLVFWLANGSLMDVPLRVSLAEGGQISVALAPSLEPGLEPGEELARCSRTTVWKIFVLTSLILAVAAFGYWMVHEGLVPFPLPRNGNQGELAPGPVIEGEVLPQLAPSPPILSDTAAMSSTTPVDVEIEQDPQVESQPQPEDQVDPQGPSEPESDGQQPSLSSESTSGLAPESASPVEPQLAAASPVYISRTGVYRLERDAVQFRLMDRDGTVYPAPDMPPLTARVVNAVDGSDRGVRADGLVWVNEDVINNLVPDSNRWQGLQVIWSPFWERCPVRVEGPTERSTLAGS